jgi:hypothetical protein
MPLVYKTDAPNKGWSTAKAGWRPGASRHAPLGALAWRHSNSAGYRVRTKQKEKKEVKFGIFPRPGLIVCYKTSSIWFSN